MKLTILAAIVFAATLLGPVTSHAMSPEATDLQTVGYYGRNFSHYLPKFYNYQKPKYHYKRGYRSNRHYRSHRYGRRYGYRNSYRHGYRGYR